MNELCIYIALFYCVLLYTQSALHSYGGGFSPQPPPVCSIHLYDATAAAAQRRRCAHHTPDTGGEERVIESIKCTGIIRIIWPTFIVYRDYTVKIIIILMLKTVKMQVGPIDRTPDPIYLTLLLHMRLLALKT